MNLIPNFFIRVYSLYDADNRLLGIVHNRKEVVPLSMGNGTLNSTVKNKR